MASIAQIRNRAAESLGILPIGQVLENQYVVRLEQAYAEVYAEIKEHGLAFWAADADIPDKFTPHIIALVAFNALSLGASDSRAAKVSAQASEAIPMIRELGATRYTSDSYPKDY